jgi:hypothetical protein
MDAIGSSPGSSSSASTSTPTNRTGSSGWSSAYERIHRITVRISSVR